MGRAPFRVRRGCPKDDRGLRGAGGTPSVSLRGATAGRDEAIPAPQPRTPAPDLDALPPWQRPSADSLARLQHTARSGANLFAELLQTVCSCSLGQITHALYEVGGQYRRSM